METGRNSAAGNANANSTVMTPGASSSGSVVRRLVADGEEVKEYVSGAEVYDLLLKNGCVGDEGRFIWKSGGSCSQDEVGEEVQTFLLEEQGVLAGQ
jgi:ATP sulfurylase